jgi:hypothetical protein
MTEKIFLSGLSPEQQALVHQIRSWIEEYEGNLETSMGEIMGAPFLKLQVEGKYKYGFTCGKHLTFHNWVMYCNPKIREQYAGKLGVPKSRVQKSCINIRPGDKLDEAVFKAMFQAGANSPVADF